MEKFTFVKFAPVNTAFERFTPDRSAFVKFAYEKFTELHDRDDGITIPDMSFDDMFTPDPIRNPDIIEYPLGNTTALPPLPPFNPDDARFVNVIVERFSPDKLVLRIAAPDRSVFVNVVLVSVAPERSTPRIERFAKVCPVSAALTSETPLPTI